MLLLIVIWLKTNVNADAHGADAHDTYKCAM